MTNTTPAQTDTWPSLEDHLTSLDNSFLQSKLPRELTSYCILRSDVRRPRVMLGDHPVPDDRGDELIEPAIDAVDAGVITVSQYDQLFLLFRLCAKATVIRARRKPDMAQIWISGIASGDINRDAIDRARQCADTLIAIFGEPAIPIAAGRRITEAQTQYAQSLGVEIIIME